MKIVRKEVSREQLEAIREMLGREFVILIVVPEEIKRRGQADAGIANVEVIASVPVDAVEYVVLSFATVIANEQTWSEETENG